MIDRVVPKLRPGWILASALFPLAMLVGLAPAAFLGRENFVLRDLLLGYRPYRMLFGRLVEVSGGLPLWNPDIASGVPLAADPVHGAFHPAVWLFTILPFEWAFRANVAIPVLVTFLGMRHLLRSLGQSEEGALFGATTWAFGGFFLSTVNLLQLALTLSPLPFLVASLLRVGRGGGAQGVAGAALSFGFMCLGGEPSALVSTAMLIPFVLLRSWLSAAGNQGAAPGRRRLAMQLAALVLGAAVGAAMLLPASDLFRKSERGKGFDIPGASSEWSLHPLRVAELVAPRALGHFEPTAPPGSYWGATLFPGRGWPLLFSLYPGLVATILAVVGVRKGWAENRVWIGIAIVSLAFSLGHHLPAVDALRRHLPILSGLRYPERLLGGAFFGLSILAACGFDRLLENGAAARRLALGLLSGTAAVALGAAGAFVAGVLVLPPAVGNWFVPDLARVAAMALAAAGAVVLVGRSPRLGAASLLLLLGTDLAVIGRPLFLSAPVERLLQPPPALARRAALGVDGPLFDSTVVDADPASLLGAVPPPMPALWGVPTTLDTDMARTQPPFTRKGTELFWAAIGEDVSLETPLLARRGVGSVLRAGAERDPASGMREVRLEVLHFHQPFAFCAEGVFPVANETEWLREVRRLGSKVASTALVAGKVPQGLSANPPPCRVTIPKRLPDQVTLDVEAAGPGDSLLAVNQSWDEGWQARIDGTPAPILRTDISLSAVAVPAGRHRIELSFRARWVESGLVISGAGLVVVLALFVVASRRTEIPKEASS